MLANTVGLGAGRSVGVVLGSSEEVIVAGYVGVSVGGVGPGCCNER